MRECDTTREGMSVREIAKEGEREKRDRDRNGMKV